jgi:SAM-dependent methyltransferase
VKQSAPAVARNREPIREVLARELPTSGVVLEISSGTGEHAVHLARSFPGITWQPSDVDGAALASIAAWREESGLANLREPLRLDATSLDWPAADAVVCINLIHIAPWEAALGLFAGAKRTLAPGGLLYLYGPYRFDGAFSAPSNFDFDRSLRSRDSRWGVRDVRDLTVAAGACELSLRGVVAMPANNHSLLFRKLGDEGA